jgi:hypothetical protein
MRITHYTAKDSAGGLQFVDIYELEQRDFGEKSWTVYPPLSALGEAEDNAASDRNRKGEMAVRKYQCYLVTWDYKQRTWWMDRDIRAFYQKSAKSFGYKIRENAIWSQPKGLDVQVNLSNELWLNND